MRRRSGGRGSVPPRFRPSVGLCQTAASMARPSVDHAAYPGGRISRQARADRRRGRLSGLLRSSRQGCIWRFRRWRIPPEAPHNGRCGQDRALDFIVLKISLPEARFFCEKSNFLACGADIFETMKITSGSSALHWSDPPGCGASWRRPLLQPDGCVPWTGQARRPGFPASADRRAACVRPR